MRILFDSKQPQYKTPFGTVTPEEVCTLNIHIPSTVGATGVECIFRTNFLFHFVFLWCIIVRGKPPYRFHPRRHYHENFI